MSDAPRKPMKHGWSESGLRSISVPMNENEPKLFDDPDSTEDTSTHDWKNEWKGMPEYVQDKKRPYATIIVRLETKEDLEDFSKRIGQKLTQKTKSIWHPQLIRGLDCVERWADEA